MGGLRLGPAVVSGIWQLVSRQLGPVVLRPLGGIGNTNIFAFGAGPWGGAIRYFPTWGAASLVGWGLGSWANSWLYSGYVNPYAYAIQPTTVVNPTVVVDAGEPAAAAAPIYDYSQPINLAASPPAEAVADQGTRPSRPPSTAFKAADYVSAHPRRPGHPAVAQ